LTAGLTSLAVVYQDDKVRNRAMGVVLGADAAGALGKSLQQLSDSVHRRRLILTLIPSRETGVSIDQYDYICTRNNEP